MSIAVSIHNYTVRESEEQNIRVWYYCIKTKNTIMKEVIN